MNRRRFLAGLFILPAARLLPDPGPVFHTGVDYMPRAGMVLLPPRESVVPRGSFPPAHPNCRCVVVTYRGPGPA